MRQSDDWEDPDEDPDFTRLQGIPESNYRDLRIMSAFFNNHPIDSSEEEASVGAIRMDSDDDDSDNNDDLLPMLNDFDDENDNITRILFGPNFDPPYATVQQLNFLRNEPALIQEMRRANGGDGYEPQETPISDQEFEQLQQHYPEIAARISQHEDLPNHLIRWIRNVATRLQPLSERELRHYEIINAAAAREVRATTPSQFTIRQVRNRLEETEEPLTSEELARWTQLLDDDDNREAFELSLIHI